MQDEALIDMNGSAEVVGYDGVRPERPKPTRPDVAPITSRLSVSMVPSYRLVARDPFEPVYPYPH
jgi:hypothetical protein